MTKPPKKRKPAKANGPNGVHTALARAAKAEAFVEAYVTNGHNASAAAAAMGCKRRDLNHAGWEMLQKVEVQLLLAKRAHEVAEKAGLSMDAWARELRAVAFSSAGDLFGPDGQLIPVCRLPRHVQASLSSVKASANGDATEYKFWDKVGALQIMARHLGLFERDNAQQQSDITVRVELVG